MLCHICEQPEDIPATNSDMHCDHHHSYLDTTYRRSWAVSVTQVLLFAAPLTTLWKAVKARSCASMHLGMGILGFLGSAMWTIYGATISNFFILIPNLLGALLTLTALAVCILFPRWAACCLIKTARRLCCILKACLAGCHDT